MSELEPPSKGIEYVDSGTHELDDAMEESTSLSSGVSSEEPLQPPLLRVQTDSSTVDPDPASQGEAPPSTPGGLPIPSTVVEKVDPGSPSHGDIPGTVAFEKRKMDAEPDVIREAPEITRTNLEGVPTSSVNRYPECQTPSDPKLDPFQSHIEEDQDVGLQQYENHASDPSGGASGSESISHEESINEPAEEGSGDDFDDFEVGAEDDDFGAFDEAPIEAETIESSVVKADVPIVHTIMSSGLPLLDFEELDSHEDIAAACQPYLEKLFPTAQQEYDPEEEGLPQINPTFLSERSQSLWAQLVAPPPLQPPDWVRSRIRRLFLVSLGVPVDLDEILPASKQKKLILPSIALEGDRSPGRIPGTPTNGAERMPPGQTGSSTSAPKLDRKQRGPAPPPDIDVNAIRILCSTTDTALANFTREDLLAHMSRLQELTQRASDVLEWWLIQKDSALGDKQAFEEVIENLVKHAQKIRK